MTTRVNAVEKMSPAIMPFVMGAQSAPPKSERGNNPPTVVIAFPVQAAGERRPRLARAYDDRIVSCSHDFILPV